MYARDKELISLLSGKDYVAPEALAKHFGVSDRSIRTYVHHANDNLKGVGRIINQSNRGYLLVVDDEEALRSWEAGYDTGRARDLPQTNTERVNYLLDDLLSRTDWITSSQLADILYVSPRTISANLKEVEEVLTRFDLTLERRPHYGIRVVGPELKRRICLANVAMSVITGGGSASDLMLDRVARCVDAALSVENYEVNSVAYQNLLVHIGVAVLRLRDGNVVPFDEERLVKVQSNREYAVASRIAKQINEAFDTNLPDEEIAYIAVHLMGKQLIDAPLSEDGDATISDEVWDVVSKMLEVIDSTFHFDFRNDLELRMNLARHIAPLSVRLRYHMNLTNPLLSDIKQRFPLAYSMALEATTVLTSTYDATVSEDEIGYIALALALALERQKAEPVKKNILVVCASGMGSARLLEYQYRKEFGAYLDKVIACDLAQIDRIDFTDIDYVFTTVPINRRLPVPVREVGFFLSQDERENLHALLRGQGTTPVLSHGFESRLFFSQLKLQTKDDVLRFLCEQASAVKETDADFYNLVCKREELAQTAFGNLVAMPHPITPASEQTFVAVALLDKAISWGTQQVQAVFLVSIAKDEDPPKDFYERLAALFGSEKAIRELLETQTYEHLLQVIDHIAINREGE